MWKSISRDCFLVLIYVWGRLDLPNAAGDTAGVVDADELVAGGCNVEVGLFLVHEERVWHPNVLDELGAYRQRLDPGSFPIRQPRVRPKLTEVKIEREVLRNT